MINFTVCGLLFGFGVYQAHYEAMMGQDDSPFSDASVAEIDLIGTLSISLMSVGAPYAVAWTRQFGPRPVVCSGSLLCGIAGILASYSTRLWQFQLTQGLLLGIGTSLTYAPSMAVSPAWFGRNRGLAIGIISAGTGIGGLVWAPAITASIQEMGFRNTLRLTSALETTLGCIAAFSLSWEPSVADAIDAQKVATSRSKRMLNISFPTWHTMRQRKFIAQALSAAFQSAAYYTPTFFIVSYAKTLAYDDATGANVTAASNACNAIGKIIAGVVADRIGRLNSLCLTSIASAAASALWIGSTISGTNDTTTGRALFLSFTVSYSLFASAYVSLFPPTLGDVFGIQEMPRIMGFMFMMQGIAAMVGTPVAGILTHSKGMTMNSNDYVGMASLVTGLMFAAAVAAVWVKLEEDL